MGKSVKSGLPDIKDLLEAGVHFGHESKRWDPNFNKYIFAKRDKFHIIDLEQTITCLEKALNFLKKAAGQGEVLFIGTKRQARDFVKEGALECGAAYVVNRWPGGFFTNFPVILKSMKKLIDIETTLEEKSFELSQQDLSILRREWARLDRLFSGVKLLTRVPSCMVVIDANFEKIAVREARKKGIKVVALVDSNTDPSTVDFPIPANDDALKSIELFMSYFKNAVLEGNKGNGLKHVIKDFSKVGIKEAKDIEKNKEEIKGKEVEIKEEIKIDNKKDGVEKVKKVSKKSVKKKSVKSAKKKSAVKKTTRKKTKTKKVAKK